MPKFTLSTNQLAELKSLIKGQVLTDNASLIAYSTDASIYSECPAAVIVPTSNNDIAQIVK
jgi:FAD/FMN-containing dehydrogenase